MRTTLQRFLFLAGVIVLVQGVGRAEDMPSPPTAADIDAQYVATLSAMKHPAVTGILVTEIAPGSPAGAAGLRAGDIIIRLAGQDVRNLAALRTMVSELLAASAVGEKAQTIPLAIRREVPLKGGASSGQSEMKTLTLQVPRQPLGVRAIEVEAGVPAHLNPPPSPRGSITLAWDDLRKLQTAGGDFGQKVFLRTHDADGAWLGWQERTVEPIGEDALSGTVEVSRISTDEQKTSVTATESVTYRVRTGDYKTSPAFLLESAEVVTKAGDGAIVKTTALRAGLNLRSEVETTFPGRIEGPFKHETACPTTALIPAAVPLVAAAMPLEKDAVLAIHLMSARDFMPRPGYVLATRGKERMPEESPRVAATKPAVPAEAWRVDLLHCGTTIESYWLNDQRRLVRVDTFSGTTLVSRRVASETEARVTATPKN